MAKLTIEPSGHIAHIASSPACKRGAPTDAAMKPGLSIPQTVGGSHQCRAKGIDQRIGCLETQLANQFLMEQILLLHALCTFPGIDQFEVVVIDETQIGRTLCIPLQLLAERIGTICQRLKMLTRISSQVTIALHLHLRDRPAKCDELQSLVLAQVFLGETLCFKLPECMIAFLLRNGPHTKFSSAPLLISHHIFAYASFIIGTAIGSGIQGIKPVADLQVKLDIPGLALVIGCKKRTIAGFESPVGMRTIKSTGIPVPSVFTNETATFRKILQFTLACIHGRPGQQKK